MDSASVKWQNTANGVPACHTTCIGHTIRMDMGGGQAKACFCKTTI